MIFHGEVVLVVGQRFRLVLDGTYPEPEGFQFRKFFFQPLGERMAQTVGGVLLSFRGAYRGKCFILSRHGHGHQFVVIDVLAATSGPAVKPWESWLRMDHARMPYAVRFLTGEQVFVLKKISVAIGRDTGRLVGDVHGVFPWTSQFFDGCFRRFPASGGEVVVDHEPVVVACFRVKGEAARTPNRLLFRKLPDPS